MRPVNLVFIGLALGFIRPPPVCAQAPVPSGAVITIAGNGVEGFSGDGGPALDASISGHYGSAIGPDGTLYFADNNNFRIRAVDPATGIITTVAGNGNLGDDNPNDGPATEADLSGVVGIAVDRARNALYIGDFGQNWVSKVDLPSNLLSRFAGTGIGGLGFSGDGGPATSASLGFPYGVATDAAGNLFFSDVINFRIRRVDPVTGIITTIAGNGDNVSAGDGGPATAASFGSLTPLVAADSAGNIFVVDEDAGANKVIRRIDAITGIIATVAGGGVTTPGTGPAIDMDLGPAYALAVDDAGTLFVGSGNQVFKVDLGTGQLTPFAGAAISGFSGDGGPALDARFFTIFGLSLAPGGGLIISDTQNARVRYVAPDSINLSGDSGQTDFYLPWVSALSRDLIITNNPNLSVINASALVTVAGDLDISDNTSATVINAGALVSVAGDLNVSGNILVGELDLPSLISAGELTITDNTSAQAIDASALVTVAGDLVISDNTSATVINASALVTVAGDLNVSGNILAGELDLPSLISAGELTITDNTSAQAINASALVTVAGDLDISDNTSATSVHISSLSSAGGNVAISGNTSAMDVDLSGLVSSGGAVSANGNTSATSVDFSSLVSANGDVTVEDNTSATAVHINSLMSAGGNVAINGNSAATAIDLGSLGSVGGDISIMENTSATAIDLSSLVSTSGEIDINANSSAGLIDLSVLASVGLISITENTSATTIDLGSLGSVGGDIEIRGNASATAIDLSSLVSTSGDIDISANSSAGLIDLSVLASVGLISITDNTSAQTIDLGSLGSVGGDIEISNNTSSTSIDLASLVSTSGNISITENSSATTIDLSSLGTVGGDIKIETYSTGTLDLSGVAVGGDASLTAGGYTEVDAATAGGETSVTMLNREATMEVTLPDGAFTSETPVAFSITNLPGGSVETVGGETVTHLETYAFDFAIPTLNSAAELNFEIELAALDEPDRLVLLDLLHESAELTLSVRGDAPGADLQLFDVCAGGGPSVDGCVVVEWLDANRMLLDPLAGLDPSILRFESLVGHFSTYSVVAVGLAGDYDRNGVVDAADYTVWRNTLGQSGTDLAADGNGNNQIDAGDLDVWRARFSNTSGSGSGDAAGLFNRADTAVPEPATLAMLVVGMLATLFRRGCVGVVATGMLIVTTAHRARSLWATISGSVPGIDRLGRRFERVLASFAIATVFACVVFPAVHARGSLQFAEWATIDVTGNTASGSIGPIAVTFSGSNVSGGVTDNSFTGFNNAFFAPPLPASDRVNFDTTPSIFNYTITFDPAVTDPRLHLFSYASVLDFGAIPLTKLSGQDTFVVAGSTVTGAANDFPPAGTPTDANGTVQLNGTFTSVNFTATFPPGNDAIVLQIGADVAVGLAGDYNHNGVVDAADYTVWRDTLGQSGTDLAADGNGNNQIDAGDLDVWRAHFGNSSGNGLGAAGLLNRADTAVPEPAGFTLAAIACLFAVWRRREC